MPPPWVKLTISAPPGPREALEGLLVDWGANGTIQEGGALSAYFPASQRAEIEARLSRYTTDLGAPIGWRWEDEPDGDWQERWKRFYKPIRVSPRLGVCPSWEEWPGPDDGVCVIRMDPGRAFGTGAHETTRLCLRLLDGLLAERQGERVLDVGSGSGILSIAAALLGASRVLALDIDPWATEATRENARRNGVASRIRVVRGDVRCVRPRYPLVVANILFQVLAGTAPELARRVESGGRLILSGFLVPEAGPVERIYSRQGLRPLRLDTEGEWAALVLGRD